MTTITFDTFKFIKTLKETGMPEAQAEAISTVVRESHEASELATKQDVFVLEERVDSKFELLRHEIADVRKDLHTEIADVRKDMQFMEQRIVYKLGSLIVSVAVGVQILQHLHWL